MRQHCHIGTNVNHWYAIKIAVRIMLLFCIFSCRTLNNFSELLVITLREKCPNTESISPYSEYRKIRTRNNSVSGHFSRSVIVTWNENKRNYLLSNIMSKRQSIFYRKLHHIFSQMRKKPQPCRNLNLTNSRRSSFDINLLIFWYKSTIYIVTTRALDFEQLSIFHKFYPI